MHKSLNAVTAAAHITLALFASTLLLGCGDDFSSSSASLGDEVEMEQPDDGLNDGLEENEPFACRGRVTTNSTNLNIRTEPSIGDNICGSLPSNSYVTVLDTQPENGFYSIASDACTTNSQYAFTSFIELSEDCDQAPPAPNPPPTNQPIEDLEGFIQNNLKKVSVVREVIRNGPTALIQVFKVPSLGERSLCGSKHIRSYRSEPYQSIDTLCAWTAVAQEWRKIHCPNNDPHCRIMIGDQTFGERIPSQWPHSTHRRGWCMDIWPMRKQGCGEQELTWRNSCYSQEDTRQLVELLVKHGADKGNQLFFNDPEIPYVRPLRNHDDHIHVCFKPANAIVQTRCEQTKVDSQTCPEFRTLISPQQQEIFAIDTQSSPPDAHVH